MRDACGFYLRQSFCIIGWKQQFMKQFNYLMLLAVVVAITLTSCELAQGIFKAGFYTAFIVIIIVVGLIIWLISRFRK